MAETLQSGTISTDPGAVTYTVTDSTISLTYADGVTTSMPNVSHSFDHSTNTISPTSSTLISGSVDQFHVNDNVVTVGTSYGHAQSLYSGTGGLRYLSTLSKASAAHDWLAHDLRP